MVELAGRKLLITHTMIHRIMGSTVAALELATHLTERQAHVTVYASFIDDPLKSLFLDRGITLESDENALEIDDFEIVWVHSQVLPESWIRQLGEMSPTDRPRFIFHHMSAIEYAPDEHPYMWGLEERLASLSLFISPMTREKLLPYYANVPPTALYPNPAPVEWRGVRRGSAPAAPRDIVIVSNHAVGEVEKAADVLRERGCRVRHFGSSGDTYELVSPAHLAGADLVITIGKTVQYCLVAGVPVYVYDHFGGYGYLSAENFDSAQHRNFSGRGGWQLGPEELVEDILANYSDASRFHAERLEEFRRTYSLDHVVDRVMLLADGDHRGAPLETSLVCASASAQHFASRAYQHWGHLRNADADRSRLSTELEAARRRIEELEADHAVQRSELEQLRSSWSFRVGRRIVAPLAAVARRLLRR
ncbi:hypothetical protein EHW97_07985 [Aeromicrobium camelliae]|uniref:Glycosyltransferase family 1 protein n=1 Tax=Aeromicrobium camelliae TaxID=1538144 RepID=A0A3N6X2P1_9ACTN|nr:hypothetical protein [Aeromicrobium camelliae]RQN07958.1 hypothetical protein EHW97_07985 [Aeromicrobium camelliae]